MTTEATTFKTSDIKHMLGADVISRKGDVFTVRWGFFYTHGRSAQKMVEKVLELFPSAEIVDSGEIWRPFRAGASVSQGSHFLVRFSL